MSINGVWSTDIGGAYGWEAIGTAFLEDGRLLGGGRYHYSYGEYTTKADGTVILKIEVRQFGKKRALFGEKNDEFSIVINARLEGDVIIGEATLASGSEYGIAVRYRKLGELPE